MDLNNGLAKLDQATRMLAEVHSVDDAKHLIDLAEAARVYAKQVELGLEAQNHAAEIKLRAQRRAGEILDAMERRKPGDTNKTIMSKAVTLSSAPPTLDDLGITRTDASRWQTIAKMPEETFEEYIEQTRGKEREITTSGAIKIAKEVAQEKRRAELANAQPPEPTGNYRLIHAGIVDLCDYITEPVDAIITDPPYPEEYLPVYEELALTAARLLKPGGALVVMIGHSHLPRILELMTPHIRYLWTVAYITPANTARVFSAKALVNWKPILIFSNGPYKGDWYADVVSNAAPDKRFHDWGQGESGMAALIERFSAPGQTVLDPFCGGSATGAAALKLGRRYIGADLDPAAIAISGERLAGMEIQ